MNQQQNQNVQAREKERGRARESNSQTQTDGHGSRIDPSSTAPGMNVDLPNSTVPQAEKLELKPYVPPYRLRSSEQNAIIGRSLLQDLPQPRRRNELPVEVPPASSPWLGTLQGGYGTGTDAFLAAHEAEAHIRMLAWENWALRNVLIYQYGWNRPGIDYALDVERQRLAAGAPKTGFNHG